MLQNFTILPLRRPVTLIPTTTLSEFSLRQTVLVVKASFLYTQHQNWQKIQKALMRQRDWTKKTKNKNINKQKQPKHWLWSRWPLGLFMTGGTQFQQPSPPQKKPLNNDFLCNKTINSVGPRHSSSNAISKSVVCCVGWGIWYNGGLCHGSSLIWIARVTADDYFIQPCEYEYCF